MSRSWPVLDSRRVGVTLGIARAPEDATSSSKIVRMADQALYAGKRAGKGVTRFADALKSVAESGDEPLLKRNA